MFKHARTRTQTHTRGHEFGSSCYSTSLDGARPKASANKFRGAKRVLPLPNFPSKMFLPSRSPFDSSSAGRGQGYTPEVSSVKFLSRICSTYRVLLSVTSLRRAFPGWCFFCWGCCASWGTISCYPKLKSGTDGRSLIGNDRRSLQIVCARSRDRSVPAPIDYRV